jgi:hypothetical protein
MDSLPNELLVLLVYGDLHSWHNLAQTCRRIGRYSIQHRDDIQATLLVVVNEPFLMHKRLDGSMYRAYQADKVRWFDRESRPVEEWIAGSLVFKRGVHCNYHFARGTYKGTFCKKPVVQGKWRCRVCMKKP